MTCGTGLTEAVLCTDAKIEKSWGGVLKAGGLYFACAQPTNKKLPSRRLNDFVREQLTKLGGRFCLLGH